MDQAINRRTFVSSAVAFAASLGLGSLALTQAEATEASAAADTPADADVDAVSGASIFLFRNYAAAHGDKAFAQVGVAVTSDYVVRAVNIDEYQFLDAGEGVIGVPSSKGSFGENFPEGKVLASKRDNNAFYSAHMAEAGGSTQPWLTSIKAIEQFAVGKTIEEIADIAQQGIDGTIGIDTVSGATLVDTFGYLKAVAETVRSKDDPLQIECKGAYNGAPESLTLGRKNTGRVDASFANALALVQEDGTICAALVDEFQYMDAADGMTGVPNSDAGFGESIPTGKMLLSKEINNDYYSGLMAKAQATKSWDDSISAIEAYTIGKQAGELVSVTVDAVTSATLSGTGAYAASIALAAASAPVEA